MTDEIRDGLRDYAAPSTPPAGGVGRVLAVLDRRRRRRTATIASTATALVVVVGLGVVVGSVRGDDDQAEGPSDTTSTAPGRTGAPASWVAIPEAPLEPRQGSVGVWTGSEMVAVGGARDRPCPPDCDARPYPTLRRDGAAYDPERNTWRRIADAPSTFSSAEAVWSGDEMVVVADQDTWAYDPEVDEWRTLDSPPVATVDPGLDAPPVVTDAGIVFASHEQRSGGSSADVVLDPATGTWSPLPRDPFGESYDRSVAWDGGRLWLLSMSAESHAEVAEGARSRLAVLEGGLTDGTWRVVDDGTPPFVDGQLLWWAGDRLVVNPLDGHYGFTVDVSARQGRSGSVASRWTETGPLERVGGCPLPPVGTGDSWIAGGGPTLVAASGTNASVEVPDCPGLSGPDVAVWAGNDLMVWGGPNADGSAGTATGYRSAPAEPETSANGPCPGKLPMADRASHGFGSSQPATDKPDLPRPEQAWVCSYSTRDVRPDNSGGAWYEWVLSGGPVAIEDLDALTEDLTQVGPRKKDDVACFENLGPRYLVSYRAGDRLVGVVIDGYGCGDVRLTDDPYVTVPGASTTDGIVPGVLGGVSSLNRRVQGAFR
jgi:hypothetical protein